MFYIAHSQISHIFVSGGNMSNFDVTDARAALPPVSKTLYVSTEMCFDIMDLVGSLTIDQITWMLVQKHKRS